MLRYCERCGGRVQRKDSYCMHCGALLWEDSQSKAPAFIRLIYWIPVSNYVVIFLWSIWKRRKQIDWISHIKKFGMNCLAVIFIIGFFVFAMMLPYIMSDDTQMSDWSDIYEKYEYDEYSIDDMFDGYQDFIDDYFMYDMYNDEADFFVPVPMEGEEL